MALQQLQSLSQKHSASWLKIFPGDIKTLNGSKLFAKQLTALAFSCITYMRCIFPEYAYQEREIDDVKVKIISGNYECKDAYFLVRWIKSAFDALDKKYMRELVLEILSVDKEPLEYYAVTYKYTDNGPTCAISTSASAKEINFDVGELQNATKKLITTLLTITEYLGELPEKYILQLRVNYYDEVTPSNYMPKYFVQSEASDLRKIETMKHYSVGSVETPYLAMSIHSGSKLVDTEETQQSFFIDLDKEAPRQISEMIEKETDANVVQSSVGEPSILTVNTKQEPDTEYTWNFDKSANSEEFIVATKAKSESHESSPINCVCRHTYENDKESLQNSSDTFKCKRCKTLQHLVCYKKFPDGKSPDIKCCYMCAKSDDSSVECTDSSLMKYKPRQVKHLAIYRQMVYRFQNRKVISCKTMIALGIQSDLAENMMTKMNQESFVKPKKKFIVESRLWKSKGYMRHSVVKHVQTIYLLLINQESNTLLNFISKTELAA